MDLPKAGEMSHDKKQSHEVKRDHEGELKRGVDHLREHHHETAREMTRTHEKSRKDR